VTLMTLGTLSEPDPCAVDWPLPWDPNDIAIPEDVFMNVPGVGALVSSPADYAALHQVRDDTRGVAGCNLELGLRIRYTDDQYFNLFLRDALPVEADNGLIPLTAG
jgi:hypothetical protein